ncbi:MAG: ABC transporter permease [Bacillota bacterium]
MKAFLRLFVANLKNLLRDRMAIFWFLAFPVIAIVLFGLAFSGGGETSFRVGVAGPAGDAFAEAVTAAFGKVKALEVSRGDRQQELTALKKGDRSIVVEIPAGAGAALAAGRPVAIRVFYDQSRAQTGQMLYSLVAEALDGLEREMTGRPRLFTLSLEPYQTERRKQIDFLLPGILAMALMQLGIFGSFELLSLREQKVLKSLGATPLPRVMVLGAEILVRLLLSLLQFGILMAIGIFLFKIKITGDWLLILGLVLLGAVTFITLGYMLISFARTIESGQGLAQLVQFPMMFLSGIFFPVEIMPKFMLPVVRTMPLTYLGDALRQTMVGMPAQYPLLLEVGVLAGWSVACSLLALAFWRWE